MEREAERRSNRNRKPPERLPPTKSSHKAAVAAQGAGEAGRPAPRSRQGDGGG